MNTKKNALNPLVWAAMITASMLIAGCDNKDAARFEQATEQVRKLNKAADFYFLEKKKCPASANDLARLFTGKDENDFDFSKDPWGNDYVMYEIEKGCHFKSLGADGVPGGDGMKADIQ